MLFFAPFCVPCSRAGGFPCSVASLPHNTRVQMRPRRPKEARRCARGHRASRVERGANPGFAKSVPVPCHAPAASMSVRQRGRRGRERVCNTCPSLRFTSTVKTGSGPFTIPCAATLCAVLRERGRFLASSSLSISSLCDKASPQSTVRCFGAQR